MGTPQPDFTLIVAASEREAHEIRRQLRKDSPVRVINCQSMSQIMGPPCRTIIVCRDVYLDMILSGEGPLKTLLRRRQLTYGDAAIFIKL